MQNKQLSSLALAACLSLGAVGFAALVGAETIEPVGSRATTTELTGTVAAIRL